MVNTSAPLFNSETYKDEITRQQAELYSRLYAFAAEDFVSHPDMKEFIRLTVECIQDIQKQLTELSRTLSTHTHNVPPHTHTMEPHTHISANPGSPSGPNMGSFQTLPTPLNSNSPVESASIKWNLVTLPIFKNTTGAIENIEGNKVITGVALVGPAEVYKRRMKTPEVLTSTVSIPPILKSGLI